MKCGIVKLSHVHKHGGRLDPNYYLGADDRLNKAIETTRRTLADAQARLDRLERDKLQQDAQAQHLIDTGDVTPFP